jgi:hypothetical protein
LESDLASTDPFTRNYALLSAQDLPRNARRMERPDNYWVSSSTTPTMMIFPIICSSSHADICWAPTSSEAD